MTFRAATELSHESASKESDAVNPLHAQPGAFVQVKVLEIQLSPHAFPVMQVAQHAGAGAGAGAGADTVAA